MLGGYVRTNLLVMGFNFKILLWVLGFQKDAAPPPPPPPHTHTLWLILEQPLMCRSTCLNIQCKLSSNKNQTVFSFSDAQVGMHLYYLHTVKPVLSGHSKRRPKLVFKTDYQLIQVKSIAECSKRSILQYFRPSFSFPLSLRSLLCLFLSGFTV